MALINKDYARLTEKQQKEIVERVNEAYDRGGADTLKILVTTINTLMADAEVAQQTTYSKPMFTLFLHIIEGVRQQLFEAVKNHQEEVYKSEPIIVSI